MSLSLCGRELGTDNNQCLEFLSPGLTCGCEVCDLMTVNVSDPYFLSSFELHIGYGHALFFS
jgi:hypothetical protein